MNPKKLVFPILVILTLLACNLPTGLISPTATAEPERPARPSDTPPADAAPTAGEVPTAQALPELPTFTPIIPTEVPAVPPGPPAVLPAALYFLSDQSGSDQVYRLEQDGMTLTQVTFEPAAVIDFSVSSTGRVAYVSDNDLWLVNPDGSERSQLVDGPPMPGRDDENRINLEIGSPRWSPDGIQIVFGLGGVNLVYSIPGLPQLLLQSDPVPQPPDYGGGNPTRFYWPEAWSPDGARLLLGFAYWPEAGGKAVLPAGGGQPVFLTSPEGVVCCDAAWSSDGASVYYANQYFGMFSAGLWRADAATGQGYTLIAGDPGNDGVGPFNLPGFPFQALDGWLYYFFAQTNTFPEGDVRLAMYRASADGLTGQQRLRSDEYLLNEALWFDDGAGAVIVDFSASPVSYPRRGRLIYLKADGSPAVILPGVGWRLRWGP